MLKKLAIVLLVVLAIIGFFFNRLWMISIISLFLLNIIAFLVGRKWKGIKTLLLLLPFFAIILLAIAGKLPLRPTQMPYGASSIPILQDKTVVSVRQGADRRPSAEDESRLELQRQIFSEYSKLVGIRRVGSEATKVSEIIEKLPTTSWFKGELSDLRASASVLENLLKGFPDANALSTQVTSLTQFFDSSLSAATRTPGEDTTDFFQNFELKKRQFDAWQLAVALSDVRTKLALALSDAASKRFVATEPAVVALNDDSCTWTITESYRFEIPPEVSVTQINAEELLLANKSRCINQKLNLLYSPRDTASAHGAVFDINSSAHSFVLQNIVTIKPDSVIDYNVLLKPLRVRWLTFRWLNPYPMNIRMAVDLSSQGLAKAVPLSVPLERTTSLEQFVVPNYSYLASYVPVSVSRSTDGDLLFPTTPIGPAYFNDHRFIWFETLPKGLLSRNMIVARFKDYIFADNILMLFAIALLSAIAAAIVEKK
ncbi:MAG: hypothetical protein WAU88_02725 [Candidatus Zixiibacteriota bacterium]